MAPHPLSLLPWPISHFLGYRAFEAIPMSPRPTLLHKALTLVISFIFTFCGLSVLQSVFHNDTIFTKEHLPGLITSYGSTSILVYGIPTSPLAQPRALIGGHFLSALIGIIVSKIFQLLPTAQLFAEMNWLGGSLASAIALVVMDLTGTMHPPAGTTALLPLVQANMHDLGWNFLWIVLLSSVLIMGVALVGNNILGYWPIFWITSRPLEMFSEKGKRGLDESNGGIRNDVDNNGKIEQEESPERKV